MEISSHTQGNTLAVETNSQFIGTDLSEGAFLSMVGWEKELTHKSNLKKKPMLVFLMSHLHETPKSMEFIVLLRVSINGVHRD